MKTTISVKTTKEVKEQARGIAKQLGVPLSTIMHGYLLQFIRDKKIALQLGDAAYTLSKQGEKDLLKSLKDDEVVEFESPVAMLKAAKKMYGN